MAINDTDNTIRQTHQLGQSIWLDLIDRELVRSGKLKSMIATDGLRGLTSNPAIFEKAISNGDQYSDQIRALSGNGMVAEGQGMTDEQIFYQLALEDIQGAADLFNSVYEDKVKGADGYVSLEVSPRSARNTIATADQARSLWKRVDRQNVMIKVPGTVEGQPAIRSLVRDGININVTLLFGLDRYGQVIEAYLSGLEDRVRDGRPIDGIASVVSFFLSRIDVMLAPILKEKGLHHLNGKVAIALAKKAYQLYQATFSAERWGKLAEKGARPQRLLWASTGNKDPSSPDTKYVDALIGKDTVNTLPLHTYNAFLEHGHVAETLSTGASEADDILETLHSGHIDLNEIAQQLENEGIEKFIVPYDKLLKAISAKRKDSSVAGWAK